VTHAAPYRHFADKSALIAAISAEGAEALGAAMQRVMQSGPPAGQLRAMGQAYVRFAVQHPAYFKVMFGPGQPVGELDVLVGAIRQAKAQGSAQAEHVALAAWCMVHGIATLVVDGRMTPVDLGLAEDDIDGMVVALLSARPQPPPD
jgi:AcrR family transcriptional regulator